MGVYPGYGDWVVGGGVYRVPTQPVPGSHITLFPVNKARKGPTYGQMKAILRHLDEVS